jgi:hypothetical protein
MRNDDYGGLWADPCVRHQCWSELVSEYFDIPSRSSKLTVVVVSVEVY